MTSNRSVGYSCRAIQVDGEDLLLYSGEFHYFRTPRDRWVDSLRLMKEANCNAVSTYVPWNWHEPVEGEVDLTGKTHPQRDLAAALDLFDEMGLYAIVRPGPFITSEFRNGGHPDWLLDHYPQILALNADGQPMRDAPYPPISYLHPVYLAKVDHWYQSLMPLLTTHQYTRGGRIINIQLDDEPSYSQSLWASPTRVDYHTIVVGDADAPGFYQRWLAERFGQINALNEQYGTLYTDFVQVSPPRRLPRHYSELPWFMDWYYCKMAIIDRFCEELYRMMRAGGIDVTISMLFPYVGAWYSGRRFVDYCRERDLEILVTSECYPAAMFGAQGLTDDYIGHVVGSSETYLAWLRESGLPPISMEAQSALHFHLEPGDMEEFYLLTLAHGHNGLNFYTMVGGETPHGYTGHLGRSYDLSAPIGTDGELRLHYPVIQRLGEFLRTHGQMLLATSTLHDIGVTYYEPYQACWCQGDSLEWGFLESYADIHERYYAAHGAGRGTLQTLLALSGLNYAMIDLLRVDLDHLRLYSQLWVLGLDFMDRATQRKLVEYVRNGGHLVLLPRIPYLDERMQPCDILAGIFPAAPREKIAGQKHSLYTRNWAISSGEMRDMVVFDYVHTFDLPSDCEPLAYETRSCLPCAYVTTVGQGTATLLGFKLRYFCDPSVDHKRFVNAIADWAGVKRRAYATGWDLVVTERAGEEVAFLFVVNPVDLPRRGVIHYTDPVSHEMCQIPRLSDQVELPRQGGLVLCVNVPIPECNAKIAYATSQIQAWEVTGGELALTVHGPTDTMGEIALQVAGPPGAVSVDGEPPAQYHYAPNRGVVTIVYRHTSCPMRITVPLHG